MKILIIGSGGREHALAWKCASSKKTEKVYVAPGNAGTALEDKVENINIAYNDIEGLLSFALNNEIDLTIVGPEEPLVKGVVDTFEENNLRIFGPSKAASQLEGSKSFCKDFLEKYQIPTAGYKTFTDPDLACGYLQDQKFPIVIKADGLAAGKGVIIAETLEHAERTVKDMLEDNQFGDAGSRVVIEDFLEGEEASFIVMVDGENILPMATSQDHKARDNGDLGPNTGGMGAYSPAPVVTDEIYSKVMREVIEPTVKGMKADGNTYKGFLYAGLMISKDGSIKVLEYNCRFGDPETQPIMMRLKSDLSELCSMAVDGLLNQAKIEWDERPSLGVVLAADGYPGSYNSGEIIGLPKDSQDLKVFHAGTKSDGDKVLSNGGRVLCATSLGETIQDAQKNAYQLVFQINWPGSYYRTDIGFKAIP